MVRAMLVIASEAPFKTLVGSFIALWHKGCHLKKTIKNCSTLIADFSDNFHPIHDFFVGDSFNAQKSYKYQFMGV